MLQAGLPPWTGSPAPRGGGALAAEGRRDHSGHSRAGKPPGSPGTAMSPQPGFQHHQRHHREEQRAVDARQRQKPGRRADRIRAALRIGQDRRHVPGSGARARGRAGEGRGARRLRWPAFRQGRGQARPPRQARLRRHSRGREVQRAGRGGRRVPCAASLSRADRASVPRPPRTPPRPREARGKPEGRASPPGRSAQRGLPNPVRHVLILGRTRGRAVYAASTARRRPRGSVPRRITPTWRFRFF